MIEIIRQEDYGDTREGGLPKEIRQMGKPDVGDRIYVEDRVYRYLHPYGETEEKAAYVLLGRFENYSGRQCTFIEGAIRLEEMDFDGELPLWNDSTWGYIYKKLKKHYDDMAIVGWAMDIKGQLPNLTGRIEKMHQKHFGGVHQVLFLMDTLEREEAFYSSRNNRLYRRDGFYIYYGKGIPAVTEPQSLQAEPEVKMQPENRIEDYERQIQEKRQKELELQEQIYLEESLNTIEETETDEPEETYHRPYRREYREGAYRKRTEQPEEKERASVLSSPLVLVLVVCVLGFTAYSNHQKMNDMQNALAQINTTPLMVEEETQKTTMADEVKVEQVEGKVEKQQTETQATETAENAVAGTAGTEQEAAVTPEENAPETPAETSKAAETDETPTAEQEAAVPPENTSETVAETPKTTETADTATDGTATTAEAATDGTVAATNEYLKQGYYIVQKGDSVAGICRKVYQTTAMMDKLCKVNGIEDPNAIYAGQYLTLPN